MEIGAVDYYKIGYQPCHYEFECQRHHAAGQTLCTVLAVIRLGCHIHRRGGEGFASPFADKFVTGHRHSAAALDKSVHLSVRQVGDNHESVSHPCDKRHGQFGCVLGLIVCKRAQHRILSEKVLQGDKCMFGRVRTETCIAVTLRMWHMEQGQKIGE